MPSIKDLIKTQKQLQRSQRNFSRRGKTHMKIRCEKGDRKIKEKEKERVD